MKVEILGKAEDKANMENVAKLIQQAAGMANVPVEVVLTHNFAAFSGHSFNVAKTPIVFINKSIEFVGGVPVVMVVKRKLVFSVMFFKRTLAAILSINAIKELEDWQWLYNYIFRRRTGTNQRRWALRNHPGFYKGLLV